MNPNEKQLKQDEFSVSLERELIANFAVRATGVYTRTIEHLSDPEQPPALRGLQHSGHESGPGPRRRCRDRGRRRPGHVL